MKYIDRLKAIFFTEADRGIRYPNDHNRELALQNRIIADGARSQTLMANPIFQDVVAEIYLALEAQLDSIEDTEVDAAERVAWVRAQRRALRVVCATLDNRIAQKEAVENMKAEEVE